MKIVVKKGRQTRTKGLIAFLFALYALSGYSQQLPLTNQYMFSPGLINPSLLTAYDKTEVFGLHRSQWSDFTDGPSTQVFSLNSPLQKEKTYVGATIIHDKLGLWNQTSAYGNFAYRLQVSDEMFVDFGISLGAIQRTFQFQKVVVNDLLDPSLVGNSLSRTSFDGAFGFGLVWKELKVGFSSLQIFGAPVSFNNSNNSILYRLNRQFNANLQYTFVVDETRDIRLTPLVVARYVSATDKFKISSPFQFDANLLANWPKYGWVLISYKSDYAMAAGIGVHVNNALHVGFSYDLSLFSKVKNYIGQTGELTLRYTLKPSANLPQFLY